MKQDAWGSGAERLLKGFARQPGVTDQHVDALRLIISTSPTLQDQVESAIRIGRLRGFAALPDHVSAAGTYDPASKVINLPLRSLQLGAEDETTFVLGHEVQHAHNDAAIDGAMEAFLWAANEPATGSHDYTDEVATLMAAQRDDEATANLAGWNALASRLHHRRGNVTLEDMWDAGGGRITDFLSLDRARRVAVVRDGLTISPDLTFAATSDNVEAMARYYVDKHGDITRLGFDGTSDYANYYAADAIGTAAEIHRAQNAGRDGRTPPMLINLERLNLRRHQLERNGIRLGPNASEPPMPYLDLSTSPPAPGLLHHTIDTHQFVPISTMSRRAASDRNDAPQPPAPVQLAAVSFGPDHETTLQMPSQAFKRRVGPDARTTHGPEWS